MEKEFIPYEQALELRDLGFNEPCFGYWYTEQKEFRKIDIQLSSINFLEGEPDYILAPTYSQAFRWFREKYELSSWIYNSSLDKYFYTILMNGRIVKANEQSTTYEEAELECLKKLIEITKNK